MSKQKWEIKEHYEKPSWGVGDYDEYYEVVNERGDALQATDYEGLEQIADALNGFEGNLRITTALEINQHCDNQMLKAENDHLKAENSKMRNALEEIQLILATESREELNITGLLSIATEALK